MLPLSKFSSNNSFVTLYDSAKTPMGILAERIIQKVKHITNIFFMTFSLPLLAIFILIEPHR